MDKNGDMDHTNGFIKKSIINEREETEENENNHSSDDYSEVNSLLPPRTGGMSRNVERVKRKVQWNDNNGNKLAEILVFEPSDHSDSDEEESDSCICSIM